MLRETTGDQVSAESGESAEYLGLLADLVAQTQALPTGAASIRECFGERAPQPPVPSRVRRTGCGLFGPDMTASQFVRQQHGRRTAPRRPYLLRAGCTAARCLSAGRLGDNVESEVQGLHTEALQCAGYYGSRAFTLCDHFAAPRYGNPPSAYPVARGESPSGGKCRAWAPTDR
jgi:hypothetical protein